MRRTIPIAVSIGLLMGCGLVPPTQLHNNPNRLDSEIATVETLGTDLFPYDGVISAEFLEVDGVILEGTATSRSRVEVSPGVHRFKLTSQASDLFGDITGVICTIDFDAEAGHEYKIDVQPYYYYDGARREGAFVWVVDKASVEVVAGVEPSQSEGPPSPEPCFDRFDPNNW